MDSQVSDKEKYIGKTCFQTFHKAELNNHCVRGTELSKEQRDALTKSRRIANPGCYPTGFIALTRPLVDAGLLPPGTPVTVNAISGYSGGGKGLMKIFETEKHEPWGTYGECCDSQQETFYSVSGT